MGRPLPLPVVPDADDPIRLSLVVPCVVSCLRIDLVKSKLQLDFNKNQPVEKLRRLKKKYRNVLARVSLGKEVQFRSPHDQATFEIANKIWGTPQSSHSSKDQIHQQHQQQMRGVDVDDDMPPNFNPASANLNLNVASNFNNFNSSGGYNNHHHHSDLLAADERKSQPEQQKAKKRIRVKMEDSWSLMDQKGSAVAALASNLSPAQNPIWQPVTGLSTPSLVEETVKNKISPLMYDRYGGSGVGGSGGLGDGIVSPVPLSFASQRRIGEGDGGDEEGGGGDSTGAAMLLAAKAVGKKKRRVGGVTLKEVNGVVGSGAVRGWRQLVTGCEQQQLTSLSSSRQSSLSSYHQTSSSSSSSDYRFKFSSARDHARPECSGLWLTSVENRFGLTEWVGID
uniref:Glabrous enhancer-binding protein-like DBD domain-containing protein n=1 Tax=Kalanchoe fedtschenkoi TaxID=63787 RepID=A0A7N0RHM3_KALFE